MMSRCIAFLLLVFLPLQFTWAGIAAYCQHETGAAAQHIAHHDHTHQTDSGPDTTPDPKAQWGFDNDCSTCYSGFIIVLPNPIRLISLPPATSVIEWQPGSITAPPARQPERPNWFLPV